MGSLQVSLAVLSAALLLADDAAACGKHRGRRAQAAGGCGGATATMIVESPNCAGTVLPPGTATTSVQVQTAPQVQYQVMEAGSGCGQESARRGLFGRRHR